MILTTTKVLPAAANYTAEDVVSESATVGTAWEFGPIRLRSDGNGIVTYANILFDEDAVTAVYHLDLFTADPSTSELNDNVAADLSAADALNKVGTVIFPACTDKGDVADALKESYIGFQLPPGATTLYGILRDTSGETLETAGMSCTIKLHVEDV